MSVDRSRQPLSPALGMLGALVVCATAAPAQAPSGDASTSPTLMLSVTNFEGVPVEDVAVEVNRGGVATALRSNPFGQAIVPIDTPRDDVSARVTDPRFVAAAPIVQQTLTGPVMSFRVFAADAATLRGDERQAFVETLPDLLADRVANSPDAAVANSDATLTLAGLGLFLSDRPRPVVAAAAVAPPGAGGEDASDRPITAISTRLLGTRGDTVAGVLVYLLEMDPARRDVVTASWQRSDDTGLVLFEDVTPGAYYRLDVVPAESGFEGRSTVVRAVDGRAVTVPAMVLRGAGETLSGFVYEEDVPASGSLVVVMNRGGREVLRSATDDAGFFSMGPVPAGEKPVRVNVRRSTRDGVRAATVRVDPAAGDVLVPLDLLALPGAASAAR